MKRGHSIRGSSEGRIRVTRLKQRLSLQKERDVVSTNINVYGSIRIWRNWLCHNIFEVLMLFGSHDRDTETDRSKGRTSVYVDLE